jgi:septal ring factor EnvC (AmiA/AmiB activator)
MEVDKEGFLQTISLLSLAVIGLLVGIQKLVRDWKTTNAETNIISVMHTEIERMSLQNTTLSTELGKLQEEIIRLNSLISKLNIENNKLQEEISRLTIELDSIKTLTNKG